MKIALNTVDWVVCLAGSLGHAILTALVRRTAVNAAVTFDAILLSTARESASRWIGRCAACRKAYRVDGILARGRRGGRVLDDFRRRRWWRRWRWGWRGNCFLRRRLHAFHFIEPFHFPNALRVLNRRYNLSL